jgi:hypothetical protein
MFKVSTFDKGLLKMAFNIDLQYISGEHMKPIFAFLSLKLFLQLHNNNYLSDLP